MKNIFSMGKNHLLISVYSILNSCNDILSFFCDTTLYHYWLKSKFLLCGAQITEGLRRVATLVDLGGREPTAFNRAVCKFTVRQAGQYRIAVLVGNVHVQGSPFNKTFLPGACVCACTVAPRLSVTHGTRGWSKR